MRAVAGASVGVVRIPGFGEGIYHLPAPTKPAGTRTVAFDADSCPASWPTICGLDGAVYANDGAMLQRRLCTVCAARAPKSALRHDPKPGGKRRGKPRGRYGKISEIQLRALHLLHWEQRVPINEIARRYWERFGYASRNACATSLSRSFKELALPVHDRIEMTVQASTKHGMKRRKGNSAAYKRFQASQRGEQYDAPCSATNRAGKPCGVRAMLGKDVCQFHDPDQRERWRQQTAAMRAVRPLHNPELLEPLAPLQAEMLSFFRDAAGWRTLTAATGMSPAWLSRLAKTKQQQRVARETAAVLRAAIAELAANVVTEGVAA